jgi:hypothetical protein
LESEREINVWGLDMEIHHESLFEVDKIAKHYEEKDGVPVKYVCTSALGGQDFATDIFYRSTPHPEFGNRYFAIYRNHFAAGAQIMITNADCIEGFEFGMVPDKEGKLHYSAHRHDYKVTDAGNMIDGGRAYIRSSGDGRPFGGVRIFKVVDGEFVESRYPSEDSGVEDMA